MKKGIMFFALLLAGGFCFAQTNESYARVDYLLQSGLNKNYSAIQQEASTLDETQRLRLYNAYIKGTEEMWIGRALAFVLGFGIGNFYQKDYLGGGIALGGDVVGVGLMISGYAVMLDTLYTTVYTVNDSIDGTVDDSVDDSVNEVANRIATAYTLFISGSIVCLASNIFGLVRTFIFPASYNGKLKNALNIHGLAMDIEPSLNISGSEYELTLVRFRY
jgi:hypothetical protein